LSMKYSIFGALVENKWMWMECRVCKERSSINERY
jgi:hypothetical protein